MLVRHQYPAVAEPDLFGKTQFLSAELLALAKRFAEATSNLETARAERNFSGVRSAFIDLETITDQDAQLTGSLQVAIKNENQRRAKL